MTVFFLFLIFLKNLSNISTSLKEIEEFAKKTELELDVMKVLTLK